MGQADLLDGNLFGIEGRENPRFVAGALTCDRIQCLS